ncbi:kinase-like domain-containing protein [Fusarium mexicanum]|uniref:Kinase-like domain-containing protein n=1 Tax=Fusarium mexicanum TaxID=751941 RepID=A0A8H5J885_9HYPO|nr:kinase-like domain-containing protein [Fusarium mexicanum]
MAENQSSLEQALAAIRGFGFQHPDDQLLECFLCDSVDPETTARYFLRKYLGQQKDLSLISLLSDWKELVANVIEQSTHKAKAEGDIVTSVTERDGRTCCITGLKVSFVDPLVSAAKALAQGYFRFAFTRGSDYRVSQVTIGGPNRPSIVDRIPTVRRGCFIDHSNSGIGTPEISLLLAMSRFSKAIRWSLVGREIATRRRQSVKSMLFFSLWPFTSEYVAVAFASICRLMPVRLRIGIYQSLKSLGVRIYGPSSSLKAQQLPFGMYLKTTHRDDYQALANEFGALKLVKNQTQVPVPRPLDLVSDADASYLLTTTMPGQRLGSYIDVLSDDDLDIFKRDMQKYMTQLRSVSRHGDQSHAISNAVGGPCYDYRIVACRDYDKERGDFFGPFTDEEEFNNTLRTPALSDVFHSTGHDIEFTHSDINMRNVLMHNGRISGIVDWENSGWFPDYWEYTKAHYVTKLNKRWLAVVDRIFENFGDFKLDLEIERRLWEYCF